MVGLKMYDGGWIAKLRMVLLLVLASVALGLITIFLGKDAAWLGVFLILWVALFRVYRSEQRAKFQGQKLVADFSGKYEAIVGVLAGAIGIKDTMSVYQPQTVAQYVSALSRQMGLLKQQVRPIEQAAILHDIGKVGLAESILSKAGALTEQEWAEMKRHPEIGYRMLKGLADFREAAEVVYAHHERYDGKGYPRGLKAEEIPLGARLFAVVDAYVAMTSQRPYRKAMSRENALQEILRNAGTQFDPAVARAFVDAHERGLFGSWIAADGMSSPEPLAAEA